MTPNTTLQILNEARRISKGNKKCHFHLLTPECIFNDQKKFALVMEDTDNNETLVNYSDIKQEAEAKILLELLHGIKADESKNDSTSVSPAVMKMAKRAQELTEKGIPWHHHALFPDCVFNKSRGNWVVMLEDPETKEVLENTTDEKPDADLQLIEPLFYHQKG